MPLLDGGVLITNTHPVQKNPKDGKESGYPNGESIHAKNRPQDQAKVHQYARDKQPTTSQETRTAYNGVEPISDRKADKEGIPHWQMCPIVNCRVKRNRHHAKEPEKEGKAARQEDEQPQRAAITIAALRFRFFYSHIQIAI